MIALPSLSTINSVQEHLRLSLLRLAAAYRQCRLVSHTFLRGQRTVKRSTRRHGPAATTRHCCSVSQAGCRGAGTGAGLGTAAGRGDIACSIAQPTSIARTPQMIC